MSESTPELPPVIPSQRSDNFQSVTKAGNKAALELAKGLNGPPDKLVAMIRKYVPEVLQTVIEVTFEKAKIWSMIDKDDNLDYYRNLDYDSWVNPADLNLSELNQAKVI